MNQRAFSRHMLALQCAVLWSKRISCLVGIFAFAMFCTAVAFSGHLATQDGWIYMGWLGLLLSSYGQMILIAAGGRERCAFFQAQHRLSQWCLSQATVCLIASLALIALWNTAGALHFSELAIFLKLSIIMALFALEFVLATFMMLQPRILRFSAQKKLALLFVTSAPWVLTAYFFGIQATHALLSSQPLRLPVTAQALLVAVLLCLSITFFYTDNPPKEPHQHQK